MSSRRSKSFKYWYGGSSVWSRPEVLDVIDPDYSAGITLNASGEATQIISRKGLFTLTNADNTRYYKVEEFHGGKAFTRSTGTGFYLSAEAMPQKFFGVMVAHYQALASPIFLTKNGGTSPISFRHISNVPNINSGSIVGSDTLPNSTIRTTYFDYNATGLAIGNDGTITNANSTVLNSPNDFAMRFFNGPTAINGVQGQIGPMVLFNRTLTSNEVAFWNFYLKSFWLYGYRDTSPFNNTRDGNSSVFSIGDDFNAFNPNSGATPWYNQQDKTKSFAKGSNSYLVNNPHNGTTPFTSPYEFLAVDSATATISQAQPFTAYFLALAHPAYKAEVANRQLFTNTQASDNICVSFNKATSTVRMQGLGSVGVGGTTIAYAQSTWSVIKAVYNGASSYLEVDGVQSAIFDAGSLGLTGTTTLSAGADIFIARMDIFNGVPNATIDSQTKAFYASVKAALPVYNTGSYVVTDDFNSNHYAFGGIDKNPNNTTLYVVTRKGLNHIDLQAQIVFMKSTDNGSTWSSPVSITGGLVTNFDYRDPRITRLSSGRLVVNYFLRFNTSTYSIKTRYSDDDGATWSSESTVIPTTSRTQIGVSGYIIQLSNGDLLMPFYGFDIGNTNQINGVFRSTDNGVTWAEDSVFSNPNVGDTAFQEFNIRLLQNGTILGLIRREAGTTKEIWRTTGTVGTPITWSTPVKATDGYGSPGFIQAANGTIHLTNRYKALNLWLQYQTSTDNGVTFTEQRLPENHIDLWVYGAPIQLNDGRIGLLWSQQNTNSKAFVRFIVL